MTTTLLLSEEWSDRCESGLSFHIGWIPRGKSHSGTTSQRAIGRGSHASHCEQASRWKDIRLLYFDSTTTALLPYSLLHFHSLLWTPFREGENSTFTHSLEKESAKMAQQFVQSIGALVNATISKNGPSIASVLKASSVPSDLYAGFDWDSLSYAEQLWARWYMWVDFTLFIE